MKVIKRNGGIVDFDLNRIKVAMSKAFNQMGYKMDDSLLTEVESRIQEDLNVENIQDIVVKTLMESRYKDVAIAYQSYRTLKEDIRNKEQGIYKEAEGIFNATNIDVLNENTNKDSRTLAVQRDLLAGITSKEIYLNRIIPKNIAKAHKDGLLHLHDLDYLLGKITNCEVFDLGKMLKGGCKIGNADMSEPNGIDVAVGHTVQIIASISSNTFGGCSVPYLDKELTPYIRKTFIKHYNNGLKYLESCVDGLYINNEDYFIKDWTNKYEEFEEYSKKSFEYAKELTQEAVKQSIQGLEYEINSLSTINGQTPFTTIGIGTETTWEGRMVQIEVFKQRKGGFGKHKKDVVVFPKIVFAVCDEINFNEDSPNHDIMLLGAECMTKSIYPDILFVSKEEVDKEEVLYPMGK